MKNGDGLRTPLPFGRVPGRGPAVTALPHALLLLAAVIGLGFAFAKLEVAIEGPHGWATSLPTWRIGGRWWNRWLFGGREMTGYHAWALPTVLGLIHLPAVADWSWSWSGEARLIACYVLFWIAEDIWWFLLNPAWGLARFRPDHATWHPRWVLGLPLEYWTCGIPALGVFVWTFQSSPGIHLI